MRGGRIRPDRLTSPRIRVARLMPPQPGMTSPSKQLTLATQDGHTGTFSYRLADTGGWDVRAQLDNLLVVRHCNTWRGVEHVYEWLRVTPSARSNL